MTERSTHDEWRRLIASRLTRTLGVFACSTCEADLDVVLEGDPKEAELLPEGRVVRMTFTCPNGCSIYTSDEAS